MAKGQYLSHHQQGIVKRYYNHLDSITLTKLSELVSDLAVATEAKAAEKLWKRAGEALAKSGVAPEAVAALMTSRSVEQFAKLVGELAAGGGGGGSAPGAPRKPRDSRDL